MTTAEGKNPGRLVVEVTRPLGEHRDWQFMLWPGAIETLKHWFCGNCGAIGDLLLGLGVHLAR